MKGDIIRLTGSMILKIQFTQKEKKAVSMEKTMIWMIQQIEIKGLLLILKLRL